jgi:hypothetical protein
LLFLFLNLGRFAYKPFSCRTSFPNALELKHMEIIKILGWGLNVFPHINCVSQRGKNILDISLKYLFGYMIVTIFVLIN